MSELAWVSVLVLAAAGFVFVYWLNGDAPEDYNPKDVRLTEEELKALEDRLK